MTLPDVEVAGDLHRLVEVGGLLLESLNVAGGNEHLLILLHQNDGEDSTEIVEATCPGYHESYLVQWQLWGQPQSPRLPGREIPAAYGPTRESSPGVGHASSAT